MTEVSGRELTTEEKRTVVLRINREVLNGGSMETADELIHPDLIDHNPFPGLEPGREGFKQAVQALRKGLPDLVSRPLNFLVDGDMVMDHSESTATHTNDLLGIPATGLPVRVSTIVISRIGPEGTIVERWAQFNLLELLQQLGVVPGGDALQPWAPVPDFAPGRATTPEENKAVIARHIEEIWNDGNYDAADELFHPQAVAPYAPQLPDGPDGCKVVAEVFRKAFPDYHMSIEELIGEGDLVAFRLRQTGTHQGELFGIAPTGRPVDFEELALVRVVDGRMAVSWFETDLMTMMQQLGVGPPSD